MLSVACGVGLRSLAVKSELQLESEWQLMQTAISKLELTGKFFIALCLDLRDRPCVGALQVCSTDSTELPLLLVCVLKSAWPLDPVQG